MAPLGLSDAPQELIDEIIDRCSADKRTLVACSLISRAWVSRTRKYLFSKLTLTDKTLPLWCGIVVGPTTPRKLNSYPSPSSPRPLSRLSPYVTSLQLALKTTSQGVFGAGQLLQAGSHLSAFTNLKSFTLTAVSFLGFNDASLKACFGSLAGGVSELKLWVCSLDQGRLFGILRLFVRLESLEIHGGVWERNRSAGKDLPTLRGSFMASQFTDKNCGLLKSLATTEVEYHTITLGRNLLSTFPEFNALLVKCKNHLKTLSLTSPECDLPSTTIPGPGQVLDLSHCKKLVEIQALFAHGEFGKIIPTLNTIASPQFRKLTLFIIPPLPAGDPQSWARLDGEVTALAKRVNATAAGDTLEVLFSSYLARALYELKLSDVEARLPRIASNTCVSLRVENRAPRSPGS